MDLYAENILDHYRDPRNKESIAHPTVTHHEANVSCGDEITVELAIENDTVARVGWRGEGCAISQAAMSMLSEELEGMTVADVANLSKDDIDEMLGVPIGPRRFKCALLCLHALKNALRQVEGKGVQSWLETVALDEG